MNYQERNKKALEFFKNLNLNVRVLGNEDKPVFILDNKVCLSCFCVKDLIILVDKPFGGKEILKVDLNSQLLNLDVFTYWIEKIEHRKVFRIRLVNCSLFYNGFRKKNEQRFPIFCEIEESVFFTMSKAEEIIKEFSHLKMCIV